MIISITEMKNISGQPVINSEHLTYKNGSVEFADINNLLDEYSYNLTVSKAIREANRDVIIIDICSNNSSLHLSNFDGSNTVINGKNYRISKNKVEELISKIIDICGIE